MRITAHDPFVEAEEITAAGATAVSFDELVAESDCLVTQAPLTPETHHLFDESQLRRMKPTAILVRDWRADNPLFSLVNVVVTPHAAYYSEEAISTVRRFAAEEVVRVLTGQAPLSPVNAGALGEARWSRRAV